MLATTPAQRFRLALTSPKATVKHLERLAARLPNDDVRACDSRGVTSLAVAAAAGNLEVCEWLLLDEGHEEGEISRVSRARREGGGPSAGELDCMCWRTSRGGALLTLTDLGHSHD